MSPGAPLLIINCPDRSRLVDAAEQVRVVAHPAGVFEAENLVRLRKIAGFVEFPANFERSIYRRDPVAVGAYGNAAFMLMYSQVATAVSGATQVFSAELLSVPAIFLAGFAWPSEIMPDALVRLGLLLPSTSGIDGFVRIYQMGLIG